MDLCRAVCALTLSALLLCPAQARAASPWSDLPEDHWAYPAMSAAAERGILTGYDDGSIHPGDALTWGQFLVMLSRAFYPEFYAGALAAGLPWDQGGYWASRDNGLIYDGDFLPVTPANLNAPLLRQDAAVLLSRAVLNRAPERACDVETAAGAFSDWDSLDASYREGVAQLYGLGVLKGRLDGSFDGGAVIQRGDGVTLLMRVIEALETPEPDPVPESPVPWGGNAELCQLGENEAKYLLLFGDSTKRRFANETEAAAAMTEVTVPIWALSDGFKTPANITLTVHAALADDVTAIFTEIYNDPEQFPFLDAGCYDWRGDSAKGEHNCGTAIDLNWRQNYQVREGRAQAGDHWSPGEDPYSIPPGGSVVRIFTAHGWSWGGDAWAESWDQTSGYHDYMHFSYMGM